MGGRSKLQDEDTHDLHSSPNIIRVKTLFIVPTDAVAYRGGGGWGVQPPPRNSEDIGGVLDRISMKNRRLDFLL